MHTKTTFYAAVLLKLLKLYPYTCFDPRIIVRGFVAKSYSHFKSDDDPRIETRVGVQF
jgi:hypothetical protein